MANEYTSFRVGVADPTVNNTLEIRNRDTMSITTIITELYINDVPQELPTRNSPSKNYTVNDGDEIKIKGGFDLTNSTISSIDDFVLQDGLTHIRNMFSNCKFLTTLNISSFNTSQVTDTFYMFQLCNNLNTVYIDCTKLINTNITPYRTYTEAELYWDGSFTCILHEEVRDLQRPWLRCQFHHPEERGVFDRYRNCLVRS